MTVSSLTLAASAGSAGTSVSLALAATPAVGSAVLLDYSPGGSRAIQDEAGNVLAAVDDESVDGRAVTVSAVSGGFVNASEDDSTLSVSGKALSIANGTAVSVAFNGAGTDVTKNTTVSSASWSVLLTVAELQGLASSSPPAGGERVVVTATAAGLSGVGSFVYDTSAPGASVLAVSGGVVDATDDNSAVPVVARVAPDVSSVVMGVSDGTDSLSPAAVAAVAYGEVVGNAVSALGLADSDQFGWAVARRGNLLAVGAPLDDEEGSDRGAVYLITDSDGDGDFSDAGSGDIVVLDDDTTGLDFDDDDRFGSAVALGDGFVAVGAPRDDTGHSGAGAVYVIFDGGDDWGSVIADDIEVLSHSSTGVTLASGDGFGSAVGAGDGFVVVGAPGDDTDGTNEGAVWVVRDGGDDWDTVAASDVTRVGGSTGGLTLADGDAFGSGVAVAGGLIAVGAAGDDTCTGSGTNCGAVYLLEDLNLDGDYGDTGESVELNNDTTGVSLASGDGVRVFCGGRG